MKLFQVGLVPVGRKASHSGNCRQNDLWFMSQVRKASLVTVPFNLKALRRDVGSPDMVWRDVGRWVEWDGWREVGEGGWVFTGSSTELHFRQKTPGLKVPGGRGESSPGGLLSCHHGRVGQALLPRQEGDGQVPGGGGGDEQHDGRAVVLPRGGDEPL